ncbi:hypothetical protein EVA_04148 [gut metagenome]|uniref:Uncharacterized protein n=1 Tax=gut metagenome TaxID=749906 RepID=J9GXD1_9ZZZZ
MSTKLRLKRIFIGSADRSALKRTKMEDLYFLLSFFHQ